MKVFVVVRSFGHTFAELRPVLDGLVGQTRRPDLVVIADADPRRLVDRSDVEAIEDLRATLISLGENVGPAGSTAVAMRELLSDAAAADAILLMDDDLPLPDERYLERLSNALVALRACDARVGAVGRIGHAFDRRRGVLRRPPPSALRGVIPVDYLPTGFCPLISVAAIRDAGVMRPELFVGLTEVELGVRMKRHGWNLYALADLWKPSGARANWRGVTFDVRRADWRRYYSVRNLVVILREDGAPLAAVRASARSLGRSIADVVLGRDPRGSKLRLTVRGLADGWRGRLGRTIEPTRRGPD